MDLAHGGHLTHGAKFNFSGGPTTSSITASATTATSTTICARSRCAEGEDDPGGASAYPRILEFDKFREIADEVGAFFLADMAHIAGLVAAEVHPSPIPYSEVVTTTTHKTLRGARGGMILCREVRQESEQPRLPGMQGGPLMHAIAGKAVALGEALKPEFKDYARQIVENCKALADGLLEGGLDLVSGGTDNHLILVDLIEADTTGKELEDTLESVGVTCNKNMVPNDPEPPTVTSGVRLGTAAMTTRGMGEAEMREIAEIIVRASAASSTACATA